MKNIVSDIISVILLVLLLCITPLYYTSAIEYARSTTIILTTCRSLVDEVIDTHELSDDTMADFNLAIASVSEYYKITVTREVKVTNPDPNQTGKAYNTYAVVDDNSTYNSGDKIKVKIEKVGLSVYETISRTMLGLGNPTESMVLTGRVR